MSQYKGKTEDRQAGGASQGTGWLIRNGRTAEECYLKDIRKERYRDPLFEIEYGTPARERGRKRKHAEERQEDMPEPCAVATWTMDETQAIYYASAAEARKVIASWPLLQKARAKVIQA